MQTPTLTLGDIRLRDPFVLTTDEGGFVLFGTTDENPWGGPATGFDCYTSADLVHWEGPIPAFRPPADFWADTQFWAPEVHAFNGRYFLLATFARSDRSRARGIAILVADEPTGPFDPWSDGAITPPDEPCLDGTLFVDEEGSPWLVYSRGAEGVSPDQPGIADGEMWAVRLSDDLTSTLEDRTLLFRASAAPWSRPLRFPDGVEPPPELNLAEDPLFTDGPFLLRLSAGRLLMLWSSYGENGYAMGIATSASGRVVGPWSQDEWPLWAENGGHGMIFSAPSGQTFLIFHWPNDTPHERAKLVEVELSADAIRLRDA